jgi:hypothetical protein
MGKVAASYGDPERFCRLVFGTPGQDLPGLHAGQKRYAENAVAEVNFLLPGNSWGKTEFICRYMTYLAWFKDSRDGMPEDFEEWLTLKYKGLVASYTYPIAKESFERFLHYYRSREEVRALCAKAPTVSDPVRVELANGSIIDWGSLDGQGKLVEAARRQFIFVDEAGHIPDISTTFDNILFPRTMGVGGTIHLLGTPKAHSDPYLLEVYEKGKKGDDPFYYSQAGSVLENEYWSEHERDRVFNNPRYVTGWTECPDEETCKNSVCRGGRHPILTAIGRQVILGAFVISGGYFFNRFHVGRMFTGTHSVTWEGDKHFHEGQWERSGTGVWTRMDEPPQGRLYAGAFDLGGNKQRRRGTKGGSDPTVGFVLDYTERPWRVVHFEYIEGGDADWEQKYQTMAEVFTGYPMQFLLIDATGSIDSVQEALQTRGVEVEGVQFGGNSSKKFDMLRNLQLCTEMEWSGSRGVIRSPLIERLKYELDHYVLPDEKIRQDCVMALAMVAHHVAQWEMPEFIAGDVF